MRKFYLPFLTLSLCLFCTVNLPAAAPAVASGPNIQAEQSGFNIVNSTMDQILGAIAPALEKLAKYKGTLAKAKELLGQAKAWGVVAKFFGGGLDCINALKNGWDIGTAIDGCISAFKKENLKEFTKKFNDFTKATVKTVVGIATTALVATATTAGAPIAAIVVGGLAIGVATDYVVSKIDLTKPINWIKNTWDSFRKNDQTPLLISVKPGSGGSSGRSPGGGGQKSSPSQPVKMKKHQVH